MSASEVIETIKALPPEERAKVEDFLQQSKLSGASTGEVRYMPEAAFTAAKDRVFSKHSELMKKLAR